MSATLDIRIENAYRECGQITRSASTNFYIGFLALPKELRRAIYASYAFCRLCDDIVDEPTLGKSPEDQLDAVENALADVTGSEYAESAIFIALDHAINAFELDKQHFVDVIDGCRMDLEIRRYETFDDLRVYCQRVASAVGIICISIFGHTSPKAIGYADDLGIAFQLTNILRDVREDYRNGRVYLPQSDLRDFGVSETDLGETESNANVKRLIDFQVDRAKGFYERGEKVMPLATRGRQCLELMSGFYSRILDKIASEDADVLAHRVSLTPMDKMSITSSVAWRAALRSVRR